MKGSKRGVGFGLWVSGSRGSALCCLMLSFWDLIVRFCGLGLRLLPALAVSRGCAVAARTRVTVPCGSHHVWCVTLLWVSVRGLKPQVPNIQHEAITNDNTSTASQNSATATVTTANAATLMLRS